MCKGGWSVWGGANGALGGPSGGPSLSQSEQGGPREAVLHHQSLSKLFGRGGGVKAGRYNQDAAQGGEGAGRR